MKDCMRDAAHDSEHIYRVLYNVLESAGGRRRAAAEFYHALLAGASFGRAGGRAVLDEFLEGQS